MTAVPLPGFDTHPLVPSTARGGAGFTHEHPNRGATDEWYTPPHIFTALNLVFDLDPCSPGPGNSFVPAARQYTITQDGLHQPWTGRVWLNPPPTGPTRPPGWRN